MITPDELAAVRAASHTIDSLIAALTRLKRAGAPGDTIIILSKDAEGNGHSPLCRPGVDFARFDPASTWSGEHYQGDDEDPAPDTAISAVFLWPAN